MHLSTCNKVQPQLPRVVFVVLSAEGASPLKIVRASPSWHQGIASHSGWAVCVSPSLGGDSGSVIFFFIAIVYFLGWGEKTLIRNKVVEGQTV